MPVATVASGRFGKAAIDAEAVKYLMVEMIDEAKIKVFLHCWGVDAVMNGDAVAGAVFESKSGRQAILAKTVIDATGDGDVAATAWGCDLTEKYVEINGRYTT